MTAITRWVLAHKRIVVSFWVLLTIVGIAAAGPASEALKQKFSVPGRAGYETNVQIAKRYSGTGGEHSPFVPVVSLPAGKTVDSGGVKAELRAVDARLERALPHSRLARLDGRPRVRLRGRPDHVRGHQPPPRPQPALRRQSERREEGTLGPSRPNRGRRPGPPDGL